MNHCAAFLNVFTPEELSGIRLMGERQVELRGAVENAPDSHRNCSIAWLEPQGWLAGKLEEAIGHINAEFFGFDLGGFADPFQYTVYREGGYYGWHMDGGANARKLSLTLQLSGPDEYEGGDFLLHTGPEMVSMGRELGRVIAFPSWALHSVTPVSRGTRRSLVVWVSGEPFK